MQAASILPQHSTVYQIGTEHPQAIGSGRSAVAQAVDYPATQKPSQQQAVSRNQCFPAR